MGEERKRETTDEKISANLRALREKKGLSQTEVAKLMSERGNPWHQSTVARVEQGTQPLRVAELVDLAAILQTSLDRLTWMQPEASATEFVYSAGARVVHSANAVADAVRELLSALASAERTLATTADTPYPRAQEARRDTAERIEAYSLRRAVGKGIRSYKERYRDREEGESG